VYGGCVKGVAFDRLAFTTGAGLVHHYRGGKSFVKEGGRGGKGST
jgi:hypothetical protein